MKIKVKQLPYEQVLTLPPPKHKNPKKQDEKKRLKKQLDFLSTDDTKGR